MSGCYIAPLLLFGLLACSKVQLVPVTVTSVELGSLSPSSLSVRLVGQVEYDTWEPVTSLLHLHSQGGGFNDGIQRKQENMLLVFYTFTRREVVLTTVSRSRQSGGKELSRRISADASHVSYST